jgi:hypothetical protein
MFSQVRIVMGPEAEKSWGAIRKRHVKPYRTISSALDVKITLLQANPHYGQPIRKRQIPNEYKIKYGITNLFRVELPSFWRLIYTLTAGTTKKEVIVFVLDIMNHKDYNKRFGYRQ